MHVTLRFIGDTSHAAANDLDAEFNSFHARAFRMRLSGIGLFTKKDRIKTIWAGIEANSALSHLHRKVEQATQRAGFQPQGRKFTPHVTLGRLKTQHVDLRHYFETNGAFRSKSFQVNYITLFESYSGHGGPHYVALKKYPLYVPESLYPD
tara:strand:- start:1139 stop:1591 length:453 start_codon:yes stop_codon:yes gene_type:complete